MTKNDTDLLRMCDYLTSVAKSIRAGKTSCLSLQVEMSRDAIEKPMKDGWLEFKPGPELRVAIDMTIEEKV